MGLIGFIIMTELCIGGVIVVVILVKVMKKNKIKDLVVGLGVVVILILLTGLSTLLITENYSALDYKEGDMFYDEIQDYEEDILNKKLTFIVIDKGVNKENGVALQVPTKKNTLNILVPYSKKSNEIQVGDIVTVKMKEMNYLFDIPIISATLIDVKHEDHEDK